MKNPTDIAFARQLKLKNPNKLYKRFVRKYSKESAILRLIFWLQKREGEVGMPATEKYHNASTDLSVMYAKRAIAIMQANGNRQAVVEAWNLIIDRYIEKTLDKVM